MEVLHVIEGPAWLNANAAALPFVEAEKKETARRSWSPQGVSWRRCIASVSRLVPLPRPSDWWSSDSVARMLRAAEQMPVAAQSSSGLRFLLTNLNPSHLPACGNDHPLFGVTGIGRRNEDPDPIERAVGPTAVARAVRTTLSQRLLMVRQEFSVQP